MLVLFVGDTPSRKNLDPEIPFVGTASYKVLLGWIGDLELCVSNVFLCNQDTTEFRPDFREANIYDWHLSYDRVIALGNNASKKLNSLNIPHFKLPHPSPKNRKLNDKTRIKQELEECREWLNT